MTIFRVNKQDNYSVISNHPFNDSRLSWEARGVLAYLLTKPDGWTVRRNDLVNKSDKNGEYQVRRILKELQEAGYMKREKHRHENGRFYYITEVYELPLGGFPPAVHPPAGNHTTYKVLNRKNRATPNRDDGVIRR